MDGPALELDRVTKRYGDFTAVDGLSLKVPRGCIYGFLGPNGAGKTTTLRMILDILRPTSGTIRVLGAKSALEVRGRIGYLPEEKGLYKKMKAWSVIAYFAGLKGMPRLEAKRRAHELLERYGLKDFAEARTEALSKGMGQKVQVLASIAHDPDLVILDEPFSGLDPVNQGVLEEIVQDLRARGRTVLFSTHVMQHAERLCDRLVIIARGRALFDGTVPEARRVVPRVVKIETEDDPGPLRQLAAVAGLQSTGPSRWQVTLAERADPQDVLRACFERSIRLRAFDAAEPSLHDVFMALVGPSAREATFR
ncbi:MAG: ATP-binding cassette domain-containing protein [Verrucomicrobiota bacterium]|jgi:ABC-2 type transport system ATP-binding protein